MTTDAVTRLDSASEAPRKVGIGLIMRRLLRDPVAVFSLIVLTLLLIALLAAGQVAPYDPLRQNLRLRNLPPGTPSVEEGGFPHILGTDELGRDLLSRLIHGARVSLAVGLGSALLSGTAGTALGILAGYYGGRLDDLIMRLVDLQMSFPFLLLALLVLYALGPGFLNVILVLALVRWMVYARVARGLTLAMRSSPFIDAARVTGNSDLRIIRRHLLPNLASPLVILFTLEIAALILGEAALSYLGFGVQKPEPSWGLMIEAGKSYVSTAWWLTTFPGLAIFLTALSLNLLAASLRAISDPVQRERWLNAGLRERP
ncbi:MAG: ABC transporter permease [Anaerolineaceae bacterium]|nr:ABC transporter permease [Anaerolineaceae bacterium]MDE0327612.1 ABC transporter permease [Anaerolineaceae bacterium]